ncbi:secreted RxLR effector protein 78-like [Amaranthus tricolor]|uniref:secreted RxLR effector protein 78-like n=1 Tax=Amaranthus tricolor TaxID=29722 RepID=UPI002583ABC2|nr:secreted RxLR effector protein 78-like [Amaranthus tricolor]
MILSIDPKELLSQKICPASCLFKIDLCKAYDMMDWDFIKDMMIALNFPEKFVKIVYTCISTAQFTIMLNGQPLELFRSIRGIRQGDLMFPLLFVIGMEYLSRILKASCRSSRFSFHPRCKKLGLTPLIFTDDLMLMSKGDSNSI